MATKKKERLKSTRTNFKVDHTSPVPLHTQVENYLRELIKQPAYQNGKLLPKEMELANKFGISRNTIRQATNKLENEQLLVRKKGVGTRAMKKVVSTQQDDWTTLGEEMQQNGEPLTNFKVNVSWVKATNEIASALQVNSNRKVLKVERLRGVGKGPFAHFVSYFHPRVGLTGDEDFSRALYDILEQDYYAVPAVSREKINAVSASADLARKLKIKKSEPMLLRQRIVYDAGDRPIEFSIGYYRADSFTYEIDIKR